MRGLLADTKLHIGIDSRTNSVLLAGNPDDVARARDLIARLDVEVEGGVDNGVEVIVLQHAQARDIQQALQVLESRSEFAIDVRTNSLLVRATPDTIERIKELISLLDKAQ